jgi:hypothetical protein
VLQGRQWDQVALSVVVPAPVLVVYMGRRSSRNDSMLQSFNVGLQANLPPENLVAVDGGVPARLPAREGFLVGQSSDGMRRCPSWLGASPRSPARLATEMMGAPAVPAADDQPVALMAACRIGSNHWRTTFPRVLAARDRRTLKTSVDLRLFYRNATIESRRKVCESDSPPVLREVLVAGDAHSATHSCVEPGLRSHAARGAPGRIFVHLVVTARGSRALTNAAGRVAGEHLSPDGLDDLGLGAVLPALFPPAGFRLGET